MASDTNNIGLYIGAPPASGGQTTKEVMSGIGTPVQPDGTVESQVDHQYWAGRGETYWHAGEIGGEKIPSLDPVRRVFGVGNPQPLFSRSGEGMGMSVAVDGDYMVVGAPYAHQHFRHASAGGQEELNVVAEQIWQEGFPPHTEDCFGVITITVTGDLRKLWFGGAFGTFTFLGSQFSYAGDLTLPGASEPESWGAFTWYLTSYDGGESGIGGSATIKAYPCDSAKDCWVGTPPDAGTCSWNIGFTEDESGTEVLYKETKIYGPETPPLERNWYVQGGAVYVFKKPRGLVTNATNATPIVITVDDINEQQVRQVEIQGVCGNTAANGKFWLYTRDSENAYLGDNKFALYHDRDFKIPVSGNGDFKAGGSWKGEGRSSWTKVGTIEAPFPGGWSQANVFDAWPKLEAGDHIKEETVFHMPLHSDARFGWSVDIKDGWILIGEPRGYPSLGGKTFNGPRKGAFGGGYLLDYEGEYETIPGLGKMHEISGDPSLSGRVYIYHVDKATVAGQLARHPNEHLNIWGAGAISCERHNLPLSTTSYVGTFPNARITPEYLYGEEEDSQVTYNMGTPNISPLTYAKVNSKGERIIHTLRTDAHFGHSVAFSPKTKGAPFGPDNPVTILVGAPYARIDKNESGVVGEEVESDEDIPSEGDDVPDPVGDNFGGDEFFLGDGSGDGETSGEGGLIPEPGTGNAGGTTGVETGGSGESTGEPSAPAPAPR